MMYAICVSVPLIAAFGYTLEPSSPDELHQLIADELNKNRALVKRIGLSPPASP